MWEITDITNNGETDIIIKGAVTGIRGNYSTEYYVYEWDGSEFIHLSADPTYPEHTTLTSYNGDGYLQTEPDSTVSLVTEEEFVEIHYLFTDYSPLALRPTALVWQWNPVTQSFEVNCRYRTTPAEYLIQRVEDGDLAIECGDYATAVDIFLSIADDASSYAGWNAKLNTDFAAWESAQNSPPSLTDDEVTFLAGYAIYRALFAALHPIDREQYDSWTEYIPDPLNPESPEFDPFAPGFAYIILADVLSTSYTFYNRDDVSAACDAVLSRVPDFEDALFTDHDIYDYHYSDNDPYFERYLNNPELLCPL